MMIMTYNYYLWQLFDIPIFLILFWEAMKSLVFENFSIKMKIAGVDQVFYSPLLRLSPPKLLDSEDIWILTEDKSVLCHPQLKILWKTKDLYIFISYQKNIINNKLLFLQPHIFSYYLLIVQSLLFPRNINHSWDQV